MFFALTNGELSAHNGGVMTVSLVRSSFVLDMGVCSFS